MRYRAEVAWDRPDDLTDDHLEQLGTGLPGYGIVIDSGYLLYASYTVDADTLVQACESTLSAALNAYDRTFGHDADPIQLTLAPAEAGLVPGSLDLIGTTEVGALLGVSRQRAGQLADRLPLSVGTPSGAPVWVRRAVEQVTATWDRRPGRRAGTD
jgi:hypothetical protein